LITIEEDFNIHYQVLQKIFIEIKGKRNMYICSDLFGICHRSIGDGVVKGSLLAIFRILRCNPFSKGGYDPVPEVRKGKRCKK